MHNAYAYAYVSIARNIFIYNVFLMCKLSTIRMCTATIPLRGPRMMMVGEMLVICEFTQTLSRWNWKKKALRVDFWQIKFYTHILHTAINNKKVWFWINIYDFRTFLQPQIWLFTVTLSIVYLLSILGDRSVVNEHFSTKTFGDRATNNECKLLPIFVQL